MLPAGQMGARRQRSTVSAVELLADQIHTVWDSGPEYVATVLSLDVAGAFDNVSHPRLLYDLKNEGPQIYYRLGSKLYGRKRVIINFRRRSEPNAQDQRRYPARARKGHQYHQYSACSPTLKRNKWPRGSTGEQRRTRGSNEGA